MKEQKGDVVATGIHVDADATVVYLSNNERTLTEDHVGIANSFTELTNKYISGESDPIEQRDKLIDAIVVHTWGRVTKKKDVLKSDRSSFSKIEKTLPILRGLMDDWIVTKEMQNEDGLPALKTGLEEVYLNFRDLLNLKVANIHHSQKIGRAHV